MLQMSGLLQYDTTLELAEFQMEVDLAILYQTENKEINRALQTNFPFSQTNKNGKVWGTSLQPHKMALMRVLFTIYFHRKRISHVIYAHNFLFHG